MKHCFLCFYSTNFILQKLLILKGFCHFNYYIFNQNFNKFYTNGVNVKQFFTLADLYNTNISKLLILLEQDVSYLQKYPWKIKKIFL